MYLQVLFECLLSSVILQIFIDPKEKEKRNGKGLKRTEKKRNGVGLNFIQFKGIENLIEIDIIVWVPML